MDINLVTPFFFLDEIEKLLSNSLNSLPQLSDIELEYQRLLQFFSQSASLSCNLPSPHKITLASCKVQIVPDNQDSLFAYKLLINSLGDQESILALFNDEPSFRKEIERASTFLKYIILAAINKSIPSPLNFDSDPLSEIQKIRNQERLRTHNIKPKQSPPPPNTQAPDPSPPTSTPQPTDPSPAPSPDSSTPSPTPNDTPPSTSDSPAPTESPPPEPVTTPSSTPESASPPPEPSSPAT